MAAVSARDGAIIRPRCRLNASHMRNRIVLFSSALIVFTVAIFLFEAHAGAPMLAPEHCGFWTTIDAGLSCR
ncbi:bsl7508 [Bradyrhizobium diazoefficiens USDA 110]|uniref:Bsl7508 protein n=3 Tax=Bradyrhizobium diazoefficiens TaxID=1355477 RepID=Q89DD1_BRADU|nr:hypothetical protein BJA5080_05689 [Bradyrhizobium diazoefficiens SEMIA 5080]PDT57725.1 hypothetical protein CO678_32060 [Bradyrhizobium diazoefficiens]QBP26250.1 hypothetical protein Bdiaspc4_39620 [Bradyrhizobium diazoefficiens]BAC52773.1 bsl7508 [Bradyrhizobium diazoefficiens USDA 110]